MPMDWAVQIRRHRRLLIVGGVGAAHLVALALTLSLQIRPTALELSDTQTIRVDIVEARPVATVAPEPPAPEPIEPLTVTRADVVPSKPTGSSIVASASPQLSDAADVIVTEQPIEPTPMDMGRVITLEEAGVRHAMQFADCLSLTRRDKDCDTLDPFEKEAIKLAAAGVGEFEISLKVAIRQNYLEGFFNQQDKDPYLTESMSADLFTDNMPDGAYNAQRIRDGREPLWSRDLEREFRSEN